MTKAFLILLSAVFTVAVAWSAGSILLRRLKLRLYRDEFHLFSLMAGFALLSTAVFAVSALHLVYPATFAILGLGVLAWRWFQPESKTLSFQPLPLLWGWLFRVVYTVFALLYLIYALAPELSPDGSTYHLGLVARYVREHGFPAITNNMYASLSQGVEMLFLFAFALGKHSAAALVHCAFLLALPLLILAYARRAGFPRAGIGAALFVFASPVAGVTGTSAYNDLAITALLFACFYVLEIWTEETDRNLLVVAGILAGFCYGVKYTAFLAVPYALGRVAWKLRGDRKQLLRSTGLVCLCVLVMVLPWIVKNVVVVQNPFSPFLNSLFPNPYVDPAFEKAYAAWMHRYAGLKSFADIPLEATVRGWVLAGFLGPLFLLSPVALFALRWPAGRRLMLAALIFLLPYWANIGTRFLLPALPFVALSMALVMERIPGVLPALILAHAVASWPSIVDKYCAGYAWHLDAKIPIRAALRKERQEEYLYRTRLEYRVAKMVEGIVPPGGKVFAFSPIAESYISREIVTGSYSTPGTALREALWVPSVDWMQPVQAVRFPFAERRLRKIRITQTATDASDQWSITEIYFFHGSAELRRESGWKATAQPNPWESSLALDNSAVTRWNSRQTLKPGMVFEVEFPGLRLLDSVLLRIVADQTNAQMYLEGQTEDGRWELLNRDPQMFELGPPLEMRRMAIEELLARGIGYILVANYDVGLSDFLERADLWGVKLVGEEAGTRLFEIKRPRN